MSDPEALLRQSVRDLLPTGARWALVGALAVGAHCEPRFTRDVDIAFAVSDDAEAERIVLQMRQLGYTAHTVLEQERTGTLATVRLVPPGADDEDPVLDLLFSSSGIEAELVGSASEHEVFPQQSVPVAGKGYLIALKLLAVGDHRPNDLIDLHALVVVATDEDLDEARHAIDLITERGYNRDRDLPAALDDALSKWR